MKFKIVCYTLFLILISLANGFSKDISPLAKNGVLDLRKQSIDQSIELTGEWKFYWQKLIIPSDTTKGAIISFPVKWNDSSINGKQLPPFGYASYKLTLLLPKTKESLRIAMPDVYCAYSLFLNGNLVAVNGKVANNAKDFEPHWGATVDVAENGKEAIHKLDVKRHRLILMDLHMPIMDGYKASQKIREMNISIPIIALTANLRKDIAFKINEAHINDVIVKPFLPDELYPKVKRYTLNFDLTKP